MFSHRVQLKTIDSEGWDGLGDLQSFDVNLARCFDPNEEVPARGLLGLART